MIYGSPQFLVGPRGLDMLSLRSDRRNMTLTQGYLLLRGGTLINAAIATVVADARGVVIIHHRGVVHVVDFRHVHVVHRTVVKEVVMVPTPSFITVPKIPKSIIDAAIKSYDRSPKAFMPKESAATPTPPTRRPQKTNLRSQHPSARHPVVITGLGVPGPVARRPDIAFGGANGLLVNWQLRRSKTYGYANADLREARARNGQHRQHDKQRTERNENPHDPSFRPVSFFVTGPLIAAGQKRFWERHSQERIAGVLSLVPDDHHPTGNNFPIGLQM